MHVKDVVQNMNENLITHNICVRYKHEETRAWHGFENFSCFLKTFWWTYLCVPNDVRFSFHDS